MDEGTNNGTMEQPKNNAFADIENITVLSTDCSDTKSY